MKKLKTICMQKLKKGAEAILLLLEKSLIYDSN